MTDLSEYERAMEILNDLAKDYEVWVQDDLKSLQKSFEQAMMKSDQEMYRVKNEHKGK